MSEANFRKVSVRDVTYGDRVEIIEPVNLYECVLHDDVFVGPFVEIQKGVVIGKGSKIQSHSFICELVTIGDFCVIAHGVMFINDLYSTGYPAGGDKSLWKSTTIGNHVLIGSNSTILPVEICDHVVIGAGSVVVNDIARPGVYVGNPARMIREL